jgi:hypothetical protein
VGFLVGTIVLNYLFGTNSSLREEPGFIAVNVALGLMVFVSGLINMILVKKGKTLSGSQVLWRHALEAKFVGSLFLTPLIEPLVEWLAGEEGNPAQIRSKIQFYLVVSMLFSSVATKMFREDFCNNFSKDPFDDKIHDIAEKLKAKMENDSKKSKEFKEGKMPEDDGEPADRAQPKQKPPIRVGATKVSEERMAEMNKAIQELQELYGKELPNPKSAKNPVNRP